MNISSTVQGPTSENFYQLNYLDTLICLTIITLTNGFQVAKRQTTDTKVWVRSLTVGEYL
jgi:hypothetical protein